MNNLEFYLDINNFVYCYDEDVEFFVTFIKKQQKWVSSKISFMQFCNDYEYKEISLEKALYLCDNISPDEEYYKYLEMLEKNGGAIKQRNITVFRKPSEKHSSDLICLYIDGAKYKYVKDNETISFKLNFKDHLITCKVEPNSNIKTYELHVPYGADEYDFCLQFTNNELIFI